MRIDRPDPNATIAALRRGGARGPWLKLLGEVLKLAGSSAQFVSHAERPWASATFSGARHSLRLAFEGQPAIGRGEAFIAALPDHEFALPGRLVADATIAGVEHSLIDGPRMVVEAALLVLDEA